MNFGITDYFQLRVLPAFWLLGLPFGAVFPNIYAGFTLRPSRTLELQLSGGAMYMDLGRVANNLGGESAKGVKSEVAILTMEAGALIRLNKFDLSFRPALSYVGGDVAAHLDFGQLDGGVATSMLTLRGDVAYWVGRTTSLFINIRYAPWADDSIVAVAGSTDQTSVEGVLKTPDIVFHNGYSLLAGASFTKGVFTMRLGAGYGDVFLPNLGLVLPTSSFVLDGDFSFRFGKTRRRK